ncbi:MAG: 50S ribosomal protein L25 [Chloroflexi bacterium]|nr:50S ribosomal protein L25 [Chloroflexota bacterium]
MEELILEAETRDITGKQVRRMRREGWVPAVMYGHKTKTLNLKVEARSLQHLLKEAGGTRLISLRVKGSDEPHMVLAREIQRNPITRDLLHVDFYEVVMTERITAEVPIELRGESPIVKKGQGLLFQGLDAIEVECLPSDLIPEIVVDLSLLTEVDQTIMVKDLQLGPAIEVLTEPEEIVVKILPMEKEEIEEVVAEAAPAEVEVIGKGKEKEEAAEEPGK